MDKEWLRLLEWISFRQTEIHAQIDKYTIQEATTKNVNRFDGGIAVGKSQMLSELVTFITDLHKK